MKKVKVGIFGTRRGISMAKVYLQHPDIELVAVCDKYAPAMHNVVKLAQEVGKTVTCYEDFEAFFNHDFDAVVLANYATEHVPYAIRFLKSGRHVLSEVPASETMAQAVELIEAVEQTGMVYGFAENVSYNPVIFEMQRLYERGDIGEVMYAEGEYMHDSAPEFTARITYGEKDHWRFRIFPTFYCTHSIGPVLTITGRRPVQVSGFLTNEAIWKGGGGRVTAAGIEVVTLDNGSILRSIHGPMKRTYSCRSTVYGMKGMLDQDRYDAQLLHVYREGERVAEGEFERYKPETRIRVGDSDLMTGHGNADLGAPHYFVERILDRPDGHKYLIDVYTGVDMSICGLLAYRSILQGNQPVKVPNLRNKDERDAYRNDHACTTPSVAGDQLIPPFPGHFEGVSDEYISRIRALWEEHEKAKQK